MRLFSLRRARAVLAKEFIQLLRDTVTLRMIIMVPIMQMLLFGYALNTDPKHLPTAVLSQDNSAMSRAIVAGLKNWKKANARAGLQDHPVPFRKI